jgi:hypothetical protein
MSNENESGQVRFLRENNKRTPIVSRLLATILIFAIIGFGAMWFLTNNNLVTANAEIERQRKELENYRVSLEKIRTDYVEAVSELSSIRSDLISTQQKLALTEDSLTSIEYDLELTRYDLESTVSDLEEVTEELELYKATWGSLVSSGVQPNYMSFNRGEFLNNDEAIDVTWQELKDFLRRDSTDRNPYVQGEYMCGDFARDVHNNAEEQRIRAAWVAIELEGRPSHALNAFITTDQGLVFIDCTGLKEGEVGPSNLDKTVKVKIGERYIPESLFRTSGWIWLSMGRILDVKVYW